MTLRGKKTSTERQDDRTFNSELSFVLLLSLPPCFFAGDDGACQDHCLRVLLLEQVLTLHMSLVYGGLFSRSSKV